ncbi:hypothetical protein KY363_02335 [Candidatus Woesearchaeota archaeon]|nr:hypothetical protein [Candidatus Woesearchaeota archaeon]
MGRYIASIVVFCIGVGLFCLGLYLVQELILKFLKLAIGLFLIFISIPMILGGVGMWRYFRSRGKVVRVHQH